MPRPQAATSRRSVPDLLRELEAEYNVIAEECNGLRDALSRQSHFIDDLLIQASTRLPTEAASLSLKSRPSPISLPFLSGAPLPIAPKSDPLVSVVESSNDDAADHSALTNNIADESRPRTSPIESSVGTTRTNLIKTGSTVTSVLPRQSVMERTGSSFQYRKVAGSIQKGGPRVQVSKRSGPFTEKKSFNSFIDGVMTLVIVGNTVYIGASSDMSAGVATMIVEACFAVCFLMERILKVYLLGLWEHFFGSEYGWNWFETVLAVIAIAEVAVAAFVGQEMGAHSSVLLRMLRLGRIAKVIRVLRVKQLTELLQMVKGLISEMRLLFWSFVLIGLFVYILAFLLREIIALLPRGPDDAGENFSTMALAFFTTLRCVVMGDCSDANGRNIFVLLSRANSNGWICATFYGVAVLFMNFGLFNVIAAIHVEHIVAASKYNEIVMKQKRLQDDEFLIAKTTELLELVASMSATRRFKAFDAETLLSCRIPADLFPKLCEVPRFRDILCELDIAEEDQVNLFETLDVDGGGDIDAEELVTGIAKLRGDPRRADIIAVGLTARSLVGLVQKLEERVQTGFRHCQSAISDIEESLRSR
eukprot:TRINITY_DN20816_c0_g1_i1.p1 TRINITY_DN20816_c0_g1~~TRINITY_DN20816_c0_g1_i1.p1  ORF type:complete len:606 (-),score=76.68 TRINITY_DN20816_c0_g1_i1:48-1820(-)